MSRKLFLMILMLALMSAFAVSAQDEAQYAGLDMDLSGITIRMANIGGGQYEVMYDAIAVFEEATAPLSKLLPCLMVSPLIRS